MEVKNIAEELSKVEIDNKAGVKITLMIGDFNISVFAAEIAPNTELNPHYHKIGIETYQVLEGHGTMKVGDYKNDTVHWTDTFEVKQGDCFSISSPKVHQIINTSDQVLRTIFTCPLDHLGQDRYFCNLHGIMQTSYKQFLVYLAIFEANPIFLIGSLH